ncbi:hypothetical protein OIU74_009005 [Salix koriyanagi]|uniref:Uncharacterized protein n=1 Tax=Salix koriyanagi TaxID=2511006 RepID=A0A9Q0TRA5_9ROSI|nr:hypothetical protein OIU74_009005 [Salix koriyanagi]
MVQREATGIFLRFPTRTTQSRYVSAIITSTGSSSRSRSCSKGASIFRGNSFQESRKVFRTAQLGGYAVGDRGKADVGRLPSVRADEAMPFLCYNKGEEDVWFSDRYELAEIHHGIYVSPAGIWHRQHVKSNGWFGSGGTHLYPQNGVMESVWT